MKNKAIFGFFVFISTLMFTTSCEDMLDIDSNRVVYEGENTLSATSDSVYSTHGILQCLQQVADRYVLLGEIRADLVEVNEITKTSLREIAEFNITEEDNEYLNVRDFYAIINNCNYLLEHMDTTITLNNERVMVDEYVGALSIRAWTYMQLAINHGSVPYYTKPITKVADGDIEKYPKLNIVEIANELIPQLLPYVEYDMPAWSTASSVATKRAFPPVRLLLGELYLWSGQYDEAVYQFLNYMMNKKSNSNVIGIIDTEGNQLYSFEGYLHNGGSRINLMTGLVNGNSIYMPRATNWFDYQSTGAVNVLHENICSIAMALSKESGTVSNIDPLYYSTNGTHQLVPSVYWNNLSKKQTYIQANSSGNSSTGTDDEENLGYTPLIGAGDARSSYYFNELNNGYTLNGKQYNPMDKFHNASTSLVNLYRRSTVYLRAAEALNCYAEETQSSKHAVIAFDLLRDAYSAFDALNEMRNEYDLNVNDDTLYFDLYKSVLRNQLQGVHARGCGDVHLDSMYSLKPIAITEYLGMGSGEEVTFNDTIQYIEQRIIDELALETAFEGNRFGDLIRFAKRRGEEVLAERVAARSGEKDEELYDKLINESNWYLPLK